MAQIACTNNFPTVTVVIPTWPNTYPSEALTALSNAHYPKDKLEVIIVEGRCPSHQRNQAADIASGEYLYFLDDDSCISKDAITIGTKYATEQNVGAVGGPALIPGASSLLERCFSAVMGSKLGCWRTRARNTPIGEPREVDGEELVLCNLMMKTSVFKEMAGLRTTLYPNEENELIKRLRLKHYSFFYLPQMQVRKKFRRTLLDFSKQMFNYGRGRGKHILTHFSPRDAVFFIPTLFLFYLVSILFVDIQLWNIPLGIYGILTFLTSVSIAIQNRNVALGFLSFISFPLLHLGYGSGLLVGLINSAVNPKVPNLEISIKKLTFEAHDSDSKKTANS